MIVGMVDDRAIRFQQQALPPASNRRRQPRPTPQPVAPTRSPLDSMGEAYLRNNQEQMRQRADVGRGVLNFLNPAPSLTSAVAEGRAPKGSDVALDAGLFAAGFIPFAGPGIRAGGQAARAGSRAAQPALETSQAIWARRDALDRLLNIQGPGALDEYLKRPLSAYLPTKNPNLLRQYFRETPERIPQGLQMYRAPSAGQVQPRYGSQSVPLPREIGAEWLPNRIQSAGGSGDLQRLGELVRGTGADTGGGQAYAPGIVAIEAMEDLPGITNLNEFLARFNNPRFASSNFGTESVLGPQTRYVVHDFDPAGVAIQGQNMPHWYLKAYAR
jgi:hypothetical protein